MRGNRIFFLYRLICACEIVATVATVATNLPPFYASARGCVEVVEVADIISLYRKFDLYFPLRAFLYIDLHDFHTDGKTPE